MFNFCHNSSYDWRKKIDKYMWKVTYNQSQSSMYKNCYKNCEFLCGIKRTHNKFRKSDSSEVWKLRKGAWEGSTKSRAPLCASGTHRRCICGVWSAVITHMSHPFLTLKKKKYLNNFFEVVISILGMFWTRKPWS